MIQYSIFIWHPPASAQEQPIGRVINKIIPLVLVAETIHLMILTCQRKTQFVKFSHCGNVKRLLNKSKHKISRHITQDQVAENAQIILEQESNIFYQESSKTLKTKQQVENIEAMLKSCPVLNNGLLCVCGRSAIDADLTDETENSTISLILKVSCDDS